MTYNFLLKNNRKIIYNEFIIQNMKFIIEILLIILIALINIITKQIQLRV
jgi:hypothetical protein